MASEGTPECPGCGRPAPAPDSQEAARWTVNVELALCVCPDCAASSDVLQQVEDEQNRQALANAETMSLDTVVFVMGKAKVLADCTGSDLEWLRDEAQRQMDQAQAWESWFEARSREEA
jgi:hypothetical protein